MQRILVVEDDLKTRLLIKIILQRAGYGTHEVENGHEAVKALRHSDAIDLLISDVLMPDMNGLELLEHAQRHHPHIPVIMLSAQRTYDWVQASMEKGAVSYLSKPFTQQQLVSLVGDVLSTDFPASAGS